MKKQEKLKRRVLRPQNDHWRIKMIFDTIVNITTKSLGIDKQEITRDASLKDDFAADSVDIYQLIYLLEDEYNVTIPEEKVATVKTVDDLIKMLKELGVED